MVNPPISSNSTAPHQLLIEAVFAKPRRIFKGRALHQLPRWRLKSFPVQDRPYYYGFRVKNLGPASSPGGRLLDIKIVSAEGKTITWNEHQELHVPVLNPNHDSVVWIRPEIATALSGAVYYKLRVEASDGVSAKCFQTGPGGRQERAGGMAHGNGQWGDSEFIYGQLEMRQGQTNTLLLWLTVLGTLHAIFGLKNVIIFVLNKLADVFAWLATSFRQ